MKKGVAGQFLLLTASLGPSLITSRTTDMYLYAWSDHHTHICESTQKCENCEPCITGDAAAYFERDIFGVRPYVIGFWCLESQLAVKRGYLLMKKLDKMVRKNQARYLTLEHLSTWAEIRLNATWVYLESKGAMRMPSSRALKWAPTWYVSRLAPRSL